MDLSEFSHRSMRAERPSLVFSPHPILLGRDQELVYAGFLPNETILEYLRRTGLLERMARQPFVLTVDGRRLPRTLWAHCRPKPGTLINLYAIVRGGDGKKNPIAAIAMIALTVFAPQFAAGIGSTVGVTSTVGVGLIQAGVMVVGGMVINSIFPPPRPDLARAQNLGGSDSPTYAIGGGSNRMRRYEPMIKIVGVHRVFPDFGAQPYNEFEGSDQVAYYVFDFGYNDAELTSFKIGDTPIEEFEGVEMETSGADGKLALFPGNVDSIAGVELTAALGFVARNSSPDARQLAVEISGALFYLSNEGTGPKPVTLDIEYRAVGAGSWTPLQFASDATPVTAVVEGVARLPKAQHTHGVRKEITVQPEAASELTVLSASSNTPAGTSFLTYGLNKAINAGAWRWTPPGGQAGEFVRVSESPADAGGNFVLYDATRTMSLLIHVTGAYPFFAAPVPSSTQLSFEIGSDVIPGQIMLVNGTREPLRRTFKWHVAEGQYEVRAKKSTADETNTRAVAQIAWSQLRTYQPDDADYTGRLRVGLKVRASALASGVLQQLSCIARARTVPGVGPTYLSLPGTAGNYASTPDSAAVSITGDIDIRVKVALDDWTPATTAVLVGSGWETVGQRRWVLYRPGGGGGGLRFDWSTDGTAISKNVAHVGPADGSTKWLRATLDVDNGAAQNVVRFYESDDGMTWAQIGVDQVTAGVTSIFDSNKALDFGLSDGANPWAGKAYYAELRNGIDGPVVAKFDPFNDALPGDTTFTSSAGEVWTVNQSGSPTAQLVDDPAARPMVHTSSPAWWVLDALRGKTVNGRRVYGGGLADSRIDIEGLKAFAAWCTAEGLEFNGVFDQQVSLYELVSAIALMGRATPTMQTGKHGVLWDAPNLPTTALFGMHNIMPGTFEIEYATGDLADVIEGWFINTELNWQRDFVRALVPGAQSQARVRRVELFGCTNKAQAGQAVNLYAAANTFRPRRYKWRSDWEQMPCPRGDVAMIGHDLLKLLSGRFIEGGNTTTLKLPRKVPLHATGALVTIVKPDATFDTYAVDAGAGESDTLTLPSPLPFDPWADASHPPYDYRWHYGPAATTGRLVKVESFKPVSERYVDVTAVDEDPAYYASKDNPLEQLPPPHLFGQVQLQAVNVTEDGVRAGTGYLAKVLVSWDVIGDYGFADVRASIAGGPVELLQAGVRGRSFTFNVQDFTDVLVEVTAWSSFGRHGKSSKLTVEHHVNYAGQSPPSNVREFLIDGGKFRWSRAPEVDVVGYRIRYHFGDNRSLDDAHELHVGLLSASPAQFDVLPAGVITFFITAVDAAGLESVTPAIIVRDLGDPELANVVEEKDFKAESWPGTVTGGSEVGGDLEADGTTAVYGDDNAPFYGPDSDPVYEDEVYAQMVYDSAALYFPTHWIGSEMTLEHALEGNGLNIEYRTSNEDPVYGADADPAYGADDEPFYGESTEFKAWPGVLTLEGGDLQLRITTGAGHVQGAVRELRMVVDVPDVAESLNDIEIPQGGARLPITKEYDLIKTVQITLQGDIGAAISARILDKDPELGPFVECIDETQASVAGLIDATITGR